MFDTTFCLDPNSCLFPEATMVGAIYLGMLENFGFPQERFVYFVVCLMKLSVTQTSVKEKVEVFQQDVALPSFSSSALPTSNEKFPGFFVVEGVPNFISPWISCPPFFPLGDT
jgi:hypothetical protein